VVLNPDFLHLVQRHLIAPAFSSVPLFFRHAVMPVAGKMWLPAFVAIPAERGQCSTISVNAARLS
jgi:hypothetical protein